MLSLNGISFKKLFKFFPVLLVFELFFGYSGKMIMFKNISIRQVLFAGTFFSLYLYSFYFMFFKNKNKIDDLKRKQKSSFFYPKLCMLDFSFLALIVSIVFFSVIVPVISHSSLLLAKAEVFSSLLMLTLSFPIFYLIKVDEINLKKLKKYIYFLVFILSVLHVFLYIGQELSGYFIYNYFFFLNTILGKTSVFPVIMLGHMGVPRVFFTTSIFLPLGIYFSLKNLSNFRLFDHIYLTINVLAITSTMTKSLWLGTVLGILAYLIFNMTKLKKENRKNGLKKIIILIIEVFTVALIANFSVFNNRVFHHFNNSFVYETGDKEKYDSKISEEFKNKIKEKFKNNVEAYHDREGSVISNNIKIKQSQLLLRKWLKRPLLGYGYGSYLENFIRSEEAPFSYEMVFFSLLMKTGIVGILFWIFLLFSLIHIKYKYGKKDISDFSSWLFLVVSFGILVQTNPLLFNSVGIAFLLFISMDVIHTFAAYKNKSKQKVKGKRKIIKNCDDTKCIC